MPPAPCRHATYRRGTAVGLLTASLAIAAHGLAGGGLPSGGAAALLGVVAAVVGGLAGIGLRVVDIRRLLVLLGAGQAGAHVALSAVCDMPDLTQAGRNSPAMLLAHVGAVALSAVLVANAERLWLALSSVLAPRVRLRSAELDWWRPATAVAADQPLQSTLVIAVSISHRGPPVSALS